MEFEGEFNEAIDQLRVWNAGGFPQLGVHADGSKTGNCVQLVDENLRVFAVEEEIAAGHAGSVDCAEGADGVILKSGDLLFGERRRNDKLRAAFEIFRGVIVILAVGNNFTGNGCADFIVAENGDFDFTTVHAALDNDFHSKLSSEVHRALNFMSGFHASHSDGRAQRCRLHENREPEFLFDFAQDFYAIALPLGTMHCEKWN